MQWFSLTECCMNQRQQVLFVFLKPHGGVCVCKMSKFCGCRKLKSSFFCFPTLSLTRVRKEVFLSLVLLGKKVRQLHHGLIHFVKVVPKLLCFICVQFCIICLFHFWQKSFFNISQIIVILSTVFSTKVFISDSALVVSTWFKSRLRRFCVKFACYCHECLDFHENSLPSTVSKGSKRVLHIW